MGGWWLRRWRWRATVVAAYYDQPEVHFALGYHPKPWIQKRLALRRRLMAGRRPTRDDLIPFAPPARGDVGVAEPVPP